MSMIKDISSFFNRSTYQLKHMSKKKKKVSYDPEKKKYIFHQLNGSLEPKSFT